MKGYRLKPWVIPAGLTLMATLLFAIAITQRAHAYRGYNAIGGEWVLIIGYAIIVYRLIRRTAEKQRQR